MDALILFSHGSLLCGSGEALEAHAKRLRERGDFRGIVEIGYLNYSEPLFAEAVGKVVAAGATRVIVVPYFLVEGYFVATRLPREVEKAREAHPGVEFVIAEALKHDAALADALLACAQNARPPSRWRDPMRRASSSCKARPDCPLYGTPDCPKVAAPPAELEKAAA